LTAVGVSADEAERWEPTSYDKDRYDQGGPIVIAHRGASGYVPEHTLAAFAMAILQGADFIEPDLVITKDGHLIARHDNLLDLTTDVSSKPEFAGRKTTKTVDGAAVTGWFSEDFTLEEIKTLRAIERIPDVRSANARLDGQFDIPTLQEIIDLAQAFEKFLGHRIGLYPETKHPTYFDRLGLSLEEPLVKVLRRNGYEGRSTRVFIQSFEINNLRKLKSMTRIPLVQLLWIDGKPFDVEAEDGTLTYEQMATPPGLAQVASYAQGVGPEKRFIIPLDSSGNLDPSRATQFVQHAHAVGLQVHPYTFCSENVFLPANFRSSSDPNVLGDGIGEINSFLRTGIDGFFTDHTERGIIARDAFLKNQ
jgi:glycerophosphoryl diester phosphodiesterase